jgi:surface antigen
MTNIRAASYLIAALSILAAAAPATAQINPFSSSQRITHEDLQAIESASAKVYKTDSPQIGAAEPWSNPASGNAGTVTLTQVFEKDGMPCRELRHSILFNGETEPAIFNFSRCRVQNGEWKLL